MNYSLDWLVDIVVFLIQLLQSFQESYPNLVFPPVPKRGDFDLKEVLKSQYFFN